MNCPNCTNHIDNDNINIQADIAKCSHCNQVFKVSTNLSAVDSVFDMDNPPPGAWINKDYPQTIIGASTRSSLAFFLIPFMIIWSGASLGGIYGPQIISGKFELFNSLFGIPFLIGSIIFWTVALMSVFGKVELILDDVGGTIFTGISFIGYRQKFLWKDITTIYESKSNMKFNNSKNASQIVLEGKTRTTFGTGLNESRTYYIVKCLQKIHYQMKRNKNIFS